MIEIERLRQPPLASSLAVVETVNAITLRQFRNQAPPEEIGAAIEAFESDIREGLIRVVQFPQAAWDIARRLSIEFTPILGARSLDILEVASALALKSDLFLTFDQTQARLAQAAGLTINPL